MTTINEQQHAPIRQALGQQWPSLGSAIRRHYDLPPNTDTNLVVEGIMEVVHSPIGKLFVTVSRMFDALIPYKGRDIPVTIQNWSKPDSDAMFWYRTFCFPGKDPIVFHSRMEYAGDNDIVEYVKYGLGIRMRLSTEGETLRYDSQGYQWDLGPLKLHIPDWLLLGKAVIREIPISEKAFNVEFEINHPLWGRTFGYSGQFEFCD
ncbi:hypothetical protein MNBD_GAMMA26-1025 [hydrothermal vent metagenome]|uniref:DUF4166 domain-containing protein n=1 Tax=hydrothermal vent metagenome TaxID=652676 RepID=A0A3B1B438_9ZZZZ